MRPAVLVALLGLALAAGAEARIDNWLWNTHTYGFQQSGVPVGVWSCVCGPAGAARGLNTSTAVSLLRASEQLWFILARELVHSGGSAVRAAIRRLLVLASPPLCCGGVCALLTSHPRGHKTAAQQAQHALAGGLMAPTLQSPHPHARGGPCILGPRFHARLHLSNPQPMPDACPSHHFATPKTGKVVKLGPAGNSSIETYIAAPSGKPTAAVIIFPDVYG